MNASLNEVVDPFDVPEAEGDDLLPARRDRRELDGEHGMAVEPLEDSVRRRPGRRETSEPHSSELVPVVDEAELFRLDGPETEFEHWLQIKSAVQDAYVARSALVGAEAARESKTFRELVQDVVQPHPAWCTPVQLPTLVAYLSEGLFGYRGLERYLALPGVEDVMFNRYDEGWLQINGQTKRIAERLFGGDADVTAWLQQVADEPQNRTEINTSKPIFDGTLADGSRIAAMLPPIARRGPMFVIRKPPAKPFAVDQLIEYGTLTADAAETLSRLIRGGWNICVSGGTSSGKTSLVNALMDSYLPRSERVAVIEDTPEIQLPSIPNVVCYGTRKGRNRQDNEHAITMRDAIEASLRHNPDRILVGEVRGPEAFDMLVAANSGHDGSALTVHANSAVRALTKLEQLARSAGVLDQEAIRDLLGSTMNIVVQVMHEKGSRGRRIVEIIQVIHPYEIDPSAEDELAALKAAGKIRLLWDSIMILPLYRREGGELRHLSEPLAIAGRDY